MNEIEAKYCVESFTNARKALQSAGAKYLGTTMQTDYFYDKPDATLRKAGCGLRIRKLEILKSPKSRQVDIRPLLTFKGPVQAQANVKIRRELETRLDSAEVLAEILQAAADFQNVYTIQKRRASYRLGLCQVELDELPLLGCFVEIEGPQGDIENSRALLGIEAKHINDSYLHMLIRRCEEMKIAARSITFDKFP